MTPAPGLLTQVLRTDSGPIGTRDKAPEGRLFLHVLEGPDRGLVESVSGLQVTIGSARDNEIVLSDPTVSRRHVRIDRSDGILVRDLESRNGTFLGGLQIREALIPIGARLKVGRTVFELVDKVSPATPQPDEILDIPGLVGRSQPMRDVAAAVRKLAESNASVLVQGETGAGKELVARAIHELSPRAKGPFIVVDSGALSPTLIASQLFGHERGAFTGADSRREGAFEQAHGGTLFLDEVGDLPCAVQPALLGVLERRSFRRLGGRDTINVDVRVISATHRDLRAEALADNHSVFHGGADDDQAQRAGGRAFRLDLYYRLAVGRIFMPALRDRPEDIEPLVAHFARQITDAPGNPFSPSTLAALAAHPWPGNVRELRNVVEAALATGNVTLDAIRAVQGRDHAHEGDDAAARAGDVDQSGAFVPYRVARSEAVAAFERRYVSRLIAASGGNASGAARAAKMDRPYLLSLLRKHGLRAPRR